MSFCLTTYSCKRRKKYKSDDRPFSSNEGKNLKPQHKLLSMAGQNRIRPVKERTARELRIYAKMSDY